MPPRSAVLPADEPTRGVDDHETRLPELLRRALSGGTAVLVAGFNDALPSAADRVLRLDRGRVVS